MLVISCNPILISWNTEPIPSIVAHSCCIVLPTNVFEWFDTGLPLCSIINYFMLQFYLPVMSSIVVQIDSPTMKNVSDAIRKLDQTTPGRYQVEWKSETRHYPTADYNVEEVTYCKGGRMKIRIKGTGGGNYEIDSNFQGLDPQLSYIPEQGKKQAEPLRSLTIVDKEPGPLAEELRIIRKEIESSY